MTGRNNTATRVIAVAATQRSGSTLLCQALAATGAFGDPQELVNPHVVFGPGSMRRRPVLTSALYASLLSRWWQRGEKWEKVHRYTKWGTRLMLDDAVGRWGAADGTLCCKLMWHPYRIAMLENGFDADHWGAPVTWLRIRREDRLRQAISLLRAQQTDVWTADRASHGTPQYDRAAIDVRRADLDASEQGWDDYFTANGIQPFTITYEHLDADYEQAIRSVLDHLGRADLPVPPRQLRRQADEDTEDWVGRYLGEADATP